MDADQYLTERVQDQIDWHNRKSTWNQRNFKRLQIVVILSSALLPLLAGLQSAAGESAAKYGLTIGIIGVIVAVLTGIASLYRFQELWVDYRLTAEALTQEKYRYLTGTAPYDSGDGLQLLVERVESILSEQNSQWQQVAKAKSKATEGPEVLPGLEQQREVVPAPRPAPEPEGSEA